MFFLAKLGKPLRLVRAKATFPTMYPLHRIQKVVVKLARTTHLSKKKRVFFGTQEIETGLKREKYLLVLVVEQSWETVSAHRGPGGTCG